MITQEEIDQLADFFQIDRYSVWREYLQLLFLNSLYRQKKASQIYFKGGTALHFLLGSPRFSEDLDFATAYDQKEIKIMLNEVQKQIRKELPDTRISVLHQGKKSVRFRLKYFPEQFKYPLTVRLDFQTEAKAAKTTVSPLITRFPLLFFPVVVHLTSEALLTEKITAILTRTKGRDVFDLWYLLEKNIWLDKNFPQASLVRKIRHFPARKLETDLKRFLPQPQRKIIGLLKDSLINTLQGIALQGEN